MEIRFSASIIMAIEAVMHLANGTLWLGLERGKLEEAPVWCNFRFPSRLRASRIVRAERTDSSYTRIGSWRLERTVEFFYLGKRIATVFLRGKQYDGFSADNDSFWGVQRIKYLLCDLGDEEAEIYLGDGMVLAPR